jgi:hypothetical protein
VELSHEELIRIVKNLARAIVKYVANQFYGRGA